MSWIRKCNINVTILSKLIYRVNTIPVKIPVLGCFFFCRNKKLTLKFLCKRKGPRIDRTILKKKNKGRESISKL